MNSRTRCRDDRKSELIRPGAFKSMTNKLTVLMEKVGSMQEHKGNVSREKFSERTEK